MIPKRVKTVAGPSIFDLETWIPSSSHSASANESAFTHSRVSGLPKKKGSHPSSESHPLYLLDTLST